MNKTDIGLSAGIIWRALDNKGKLSFEELQSETQLDIKLLAAAIGWLAHEDKIYFGEHNGTTVYYLYQETYY